MLVAAKAALADALTSLQQCFRGFGCRHPEQLGRRSPLCLETDGPISPPHFLALVSTVSTAQDTDD